MNDQVLDFSRSRLSSRPGASDDLAAARASLGDAERVVVDLGNNLAMTSWVDGFLVPLIDEYGERVIVLASSEVTVEHIVRVLASRSRRVKIAATRDDLAIGRFQILPAA